MSLTTYLYHNTPNELHNASKVENELFNVEKFNTTNSVFPENVFKIKYDFYSFLPYNDCFQNNSDYQNLINFLNEVKINSFFISSPPLYKISPLEIFTSCNFSDFQKLITFSNDECVDEFFKGIGYFISTEIFMYDPNKSWAMVHDLTNNIVVVGYTNPIMKDFFSNFYTDFFNPFSQEEKKLLGFTAESIDYVTERLKKYYS